MESKVSNFYKAKASSIIIMEREGEIEGRYEVLPAGIYTAHNIGALSWKLGFRPIDSKDNLIKFKDGVVSTVLRDVDVFFSAPTKTVYQELKLNHSCGLILHGPHGTGKTCTAMLAMTEISRKYNTVCIDFTDNGINFIKAVIEEVRNIQSNPIIAFVDECDSSFQREEESWLHFLDGASSFNNFLFIGCTNKIGRIPARIKNRKSRIKHLYEVRSFPIEVYKQYILDRLPSLDSKIVAEFSFKAEDKGLTLDALKHAIIDFKLLGISIDEAIESATSEHSSTEGAD